MIVTNYIIIVHIHYFMNENLLRLNENALLWITRWNSIKLTGEKIFKSKLNNNKKKTFVQSIYWKVLKLFLYFMKLMVKIYVEFVYFI